MEVLEVRNLRDGPVDALPEDFVVHAEACDEWGEIVIQIWRKAA
jgi:hypothetical protein